MSVRTRPRVVAAAALLGVLAATLAAPDAEARPWRGHGRRGGVGAWVAGAVVGAAVGAAVGGHVVVTPPAVHVRFPPWTPPYVPPPVYLPPPPPPPAVVYVPAPQPAPAVVYMPPPPPPPPPAPPPPPPPPTTQVVVQAPAQQVVVVEAPRERGPARPMLGLGVSGLVNSGTEGEEAAGGLAAALQFRPSSRSLLSLELQSLERRRAWDGSQRDDIAALLGARLFLWDAAVTPYLDVAGGFGRASVACCAGTLHVGQLLGRYGLGLELRLGQHLILDAALAQVHRFKMSRDDRFDAVSPIDDHERTTEFRAGLTFLF